MISTTRGLCKVWNIHDLATRLRFPDAIISNFYSTLTHNSKEEALFCYSKLQFLLQRCNNYMANLHSQMMHVCTPKRINCLGLRLSLSVKE